MSPGLVMQLTLSVRLEVRTLASSQHGEESYHHIQSLDTTITIQNHEVGSRYKSTISSGVLVYYEIIVLISES